MAHRKVTATGKGRDGDIIRLCDPGSLWDSVPKARAIQHIENEIHAYYVEQPGTSRAEVRVAAGPGGKYLRTDSDPSSQNHLGKLPDC